MRTKATELGRTPFVILFPLNSVIFISTATHRSILRPVMRQIRGRGIFAARKFQGDLHTTVPHVVEVLHSAGKRVPLGAVSNSTFKCGLRRRAR